MLTHLDIRGDAFGTRIKARTSVTSIKRLESGAATYSGRVALSPA
jgi:hypothetical protein